MAASISPILGKDGEVQFLVAIERDVTKERQVDKAKTEFVSLASHQLRTPLSAINWYAEMLMNGDAGQLTEDQKGFLKEIYNGNQRMVDLVNSLLNVSRLELGTFMVEPVATDLVALAKDVTHEFVALIATKKMNLVENYQEGMPQISVDPKLTRIIFQNLVSNAIKYTPENGQVNVVLRALKVGETVGLTHKEVAKAPDILFSVSDSGIGIPLEQQGKIFSKLFRADNVRESNTEGTGLGLYIVKSILDQSGGKVWFESELGRGTTFYVIIPMSGMKRKEGTKQIS